MNRELEKCKTCSRWDHDKHRMRNKLYCTFACDERIKHQNKIATDYNASVEREMRGKKNDTRERTRSVDAVDDVCKTSVCHLQVS